MKRPLAAPGNETPVVIAKRTRIATSSINSHQNMMEPSAMEQNIALILNNIREGRQEQASMKNELVTGLNSLRAEQATMRTEINEVTRRVEVLESGRGDEEALAKEIKASELKLFVRARRTLTLESLNSLLAGHTSGRVNGLRAIRSTRGNQAWNRYSVTCPTVNDRGTILSEAAGQLKSQEVYLNRDVPYAFKHTYADLQNAAALLKKASADGEGNQKLMARVVFIGTKCCLQSREKSGNSPWGLITERGPDAPVESRTVNPQGSLADVQNSCLIHDEFPEEILRANLMSLMGPEMERIQILRIETKRGCTKVICNSQEEAKTLSEGLRGKKIPGTNKTFSCTFIPL